MRTAKKPNFDGAHRDRVRLFARFTHSGGQWREAEPAEEPYLSIDVYDSDIATVDYRPATQGTGLFVLPAAAIANAVLRHHPEVAA